MVVSFLISTIKLLSTVTFFCLLHLYTNFTETNLHSEFFDRSLKVLVIIDEFIMMNFARARTGPSVKKMSGGHF